MNLSGFKLYLLRKGKSHGTIEKHVSSLASLLNNVHPFTKDNLEQHFVSLLEKGQSRGHLNNLVIAVRHYGDFTGVNYRDVKYFTVKETYKATMSDSEIEEFLSLPFEKGGGAVHYNRRRYKIMTLFFSILAYSGMRPNEVAQLTVEDLDFGRGLFILERTKTTPRSVPIAPSLLSALRDYVSKLSGDYLFEGRFGKPLQRHAWQHSFKQRLSRLGIKRKKLTTYSLRHSFITRWAGEDINIFKIQRIVGHKRIQTTSNYMHLVTKDLTSAMTKDPLARTNLPFYTRAKIFRENVFKLLESFATTPQEEKQLIDQLKVF